MNQVFTIFATLSLKLNLFNFRDTQKYITLKSDIR